MGAQSQKKETDPRMLAVLKNRYYEEQKNQWEGAMRLIWNDGKLRGTHAKLMIGSLSCLLQGYMEMLGWIQWT